MSVKFADDKPWKGCTIDRLPVAEAVAALKGCLEHEATLARKREAAAAVAAQGSLFVEPTR